MSKYVYILLLLMLTSSCAQQNNDVVSVKEISDIPYMAAEKLVDDKLQRLNLLLPEEVNNPPLLLWIGGGAWSFVDRHMEMELCRKIAQQGIAVASVGHRLSKGEFSEKRKKLGVQHPEHIKDVAAAFKWLYDHADSLKYSHRNIYVGGFSSGAHLAALLAMDSRYLKANDLSPDNIRGIIPVSGAFDIEHYYSVFLNHENEASRAMAKTHVIDVFGPPSTFKAASPTTYLEELKLPILLIADNAIKQYTELFEKALLEIEYADFIIYYEESMNHGALWRSMSKDEHSVSRAMMITFIKEHLQQ
ncbi:alpha/beta hydrolase [Muriicola sp. Z0-33]|uniref:alpha/beta hydrolase n=1 Tax=Muriicola sp. Z0-33 TaxID=2816957 RepID=UPI00223705B0|nr:alpha/beta hydrolase [Muriicola sp. Z0-33]MCW5515353.1 alpha/beta hydrolase [Muriicola sp. Z0-33]